MQVAAHDDFEDAVEDGPVRSLTTRSVSASKTDAPADNDSDDDGEPVKGKVDGAEDELDSIKDGSAVGTRAAAVSNDDADLKDVGSPAERRSSSSAKRISNTSNLDNVSLDDDPPSPPPEGNFNRLNKVQRERYQLTAT